MIQEKRTISGNKVDTLKIDQTPDPAILAQYPDHIVFESYVVLYKPRPSDEEVEDMRKALERLGVKKETTWEAAVKNPG